MKRRALFVFVVAAATFCYLVTCEGEAVKAGGGKLDLRVLYIGYPGTEREKDFVGFLEKHFAKVGKGDLNKFDVKDAEGFDVVVLDYDGLSVEDNVTRMPRVPFDRSYTRPTVTMSAVGALACDQLGLKTGYF